MDAVYMLIGGQYILMITGLWLILNRLNKIEKELFKSKDCNKRLRATLLRCFRRIRKLELSFSLMSKGIAK